MKKFLLILLTQFFFWGPATFAQSAPVVKNLGTDKDTTVANQTVANCNLYRGAALVATTPIVRATAPASVACQFNAVTLNPSESYVASYLSALGFEGPKSDPFLTDSVPGKPTSVLHPVP